MDKVLVLIVGKGPKDEDKGNYINVLLKAIEEAKADKVILICSQDEECLENQENVKKEYQGKCEILSKPYPKKGMEYDLKECYDWYNDLLKDYKDYQIIVDLTHGTKNMSSALLATGLNYDITEFQYTKKQKSGEDFVAGQEQVIKINLWEVYLQKILKQCRSFLSAGQYSAVEELLSMQNFPKESKKIIDHYITFSRFCSAWDRFDYKEVQNNLLTFPVEELNYKEEDYQKIENYINKICEPIKTNCLTSQDIKNNQDKAILLMQELYANGLRKLDKHQYEDAGIRLYRMAELLGELYKMRIEADKTNEENKRNLQNFMEDKNIHIPNLNRTQGIMYLEYLKGEKDSDVKYLKSLGEKVENRNLSILIHGYSATANPNQNEAKQIFEDILDKTMDFIIKRDGNLEKSNFKEQLKTAMYLNNLKF